MGKAIIMGLVQIFKFFGKANRDKLKWNRKGRGDFC